MTAERFTYWLKGFFELSDAKTLDEKQVKIVKDHLDLVYNKVTPDRSQEIQNINEVPPTFFHPQCNTTGSFPDDTLFCSTIAGTDSNLICSNAGESISTTLQEEESNDDNAEGKRGPYTGPAGYK